MIFYYIKVNSYTNYSQSIKQVFMNNFEDNYFQYEGVNLK